MGAKVVFNENGEGLIVGFGQTELKESSKRQSSKLSMAQNRARLEAVAASKNLVAEDLVSKDLSENIEKYREYKDGAEAAFQFGTWNQSIQAKSTTIEDLSTRIVRKWSDKHPLSGHTIAGVIVAWSPNFQKEGEALKNQIDADKKI